MKKFIYNASLYALGIVLGYTAFAGYRAAKSATALSDIYNKVRKQTVALLEPLNQQGGGTGFVVELDNGDKYTMTNAHICNMTKENYVTAKTGTSEVNIKILAIATDTDLCVLAPVPGLSGLKLADYSRMYQQVYIVGHPLLMPISIVTGFLNNRSVIDVAEMKPASECTGPNRRSQTVLSFFGPIEICVFSTDAVWSDAKIFPGNSGSPAVNDNGDVIGVVFAGHDGGFSFMIPLDVVKKFVSEVKAESLN